MLSDINPGSVGGLPQDLTVVGSQVFFSANDGSHGRELWVTSGPGTFETFQVDDINPGSASSNPENLTAFDGLLFFTANDGTHGTQLWESDGTAADTFMVKDINPSGSSNPANLTVVGSTLYFTANDGTHGTELWSTTGSAGDFVTTLVKDINPGAEGSAPPSSPTLTARSSSPPTMAPTAANCGPATARRLARRWSTTSIPAP